MRELHHHSKTTQNIGKHLPFLRRYGRALSGNQTDGDKIAAATLASLLKSSYLFNDALESKVALYSVFQQIWAQSMSEVFVNEDDALASSAQDHLAKLSSGSRNALLLSSLEQFSIGEVSTIMRTDVRDVRRLLDQAYNDMALSIAGGVLIIEDDAMIAREIENIVTGMGHRVTGMADTHATAVSLAHHQDPDLILADIVLADDTSGIDATDEIMRAGSDKPVIFITGHPELLLTGEKPEPTFLIPKPFMKDQLQTVIGQAMFFRHTGPLMDLAES